MTPPIGKYAARLSHAWHYFRLVSEQERTVQTANEMTARWLKVFYGIELDSLPDG